MSGHGSPTGSDAAGCSPSISRWTEKNWSTAEYSTFYVFWGLIGFFGLCAAGWLADKIGRRVGFIALLLWGAVCMTLWVYAASNLWLWIFGLAWSFGFLGFWGP